MDKSAMSRRMDKSQPSHEPRDEEQEDVEVSILMPTLNSVGFLEERLHTIQSQTLHDWELLVADSFSDDGTWEVLCEYGKQDTRLRLFRVPREGLYQALNFMLERARGPYVYIATSDDTMVDCCLERMRAVLENFPDCDICHSSLKVIDPDGNEIAGWWSERPATKYFGELESIPHIRYAPHDGVLHLCLNTVYGSLTQILVRRSAFQEIGTFRSDWGSRGDFEWGMRAGILCNTIHVPEVLATWRIHKDQLTEKPRGDLLTEMVEAALPYLEETYPHVYRLLDLNKLMSFYKRLEILQSIQKGQNWLSRLGLAVIALRTHPKITTQVLLMALRRVDVRTAEDRIQFVKRHMEELGLHRLVIPLEFGKAGGCKDK